LSTDLFSNYFFIHRFIYYSSELSYSSTMTATSVQNLYLKTATFDARTITAADGPYLIQGYPIINADTTAGNVILYLPNNLSLPNHCITVNFLIVGGFLVQVFPPTGYTIDGAASLTVTTSKTIEFIKLTTSSRWSSAISFTGSSSGQVVYTNLTTPNAIVKWVDATGKLVTESGATLDNSNNIITPGDLITTNPISQGGVQLIWTNVASNNVTFGSAAQPSGARNTIIGRLAGTALTTGADNTLIGPEAGRSFTNQNQNTGVGYRALFNATTAGAIAIGREAFAVATAGAGIAIGNLAGAAATALVNYPILIGHQAGQNMTNPDSLIAIGFQAGRACTGALNIFIGNTAGTACTSGANNVVIGHNSFVALTTGARNTVVGNTCVSSTGAADNVLFGHEITCVGSRNVYIGNEVAETKTSGDDNVFIGHRAGLNSSTTTQSVFIGTSAGAQCSANGTVLIGHNAGLLLTSGARNTAYGAFALATITTAADCTAFGTSALTLATGQRNTAVGKNAGSLVAAGTENTIMGFNAGITLTSGSNNTIIGNAADVSVGTITGAIALGAGAVAQANAEFALGSVAAPMTLVLTVGAAGAGDPLPATPETYLHIRVNGTLYVMAFYL
jgi:hypothetical protein